jgi:hypothetical protein
LSELVARLKPAGASGRGSARRSLGIPQFGRTSSMPRTVAMAIACYLCFVFFFEFVLVFGRVVGSVFEPLAKRAIRLVLEEFAPAVKLAE